MKSILFIFILAHTLPSFALNILQVDTEKYWDRQEIKLHVSTIQRDMKHIAVYETHRGKSIQAPIKQIERTKSGQRKDFYLLIDNSGSMHKQARRKIKAAMNAVNQFSLLLNPETDRLYVATFNSYFKKIKKLGEVNQKIELPNIDNKKLSKDERATELYYSLIQVQKDIHNNHQPTRKVLIVLSDGVNYPYSKWMKEKHPRFGDKRFSYEECIPLFSTGRFTLHTIHYGSMQEQADSGLSQLTLMSGGENHRVSSKEQIRKMYKKLWLKTKNEYQITYMSKYQPTSQREVFLSDGFKKVRREYTLHPILGNPGKRHFIYILSLPICIILFLIMWKYPVLKYQNSWGMESIVLGSNRSKFSTSVNGKLSTKDFTIFETKNGFRIEGDSKLEVNNQKKKSSFLNDGDIICVDDQTLIFHSNQS